MIDYRTLEFIYDIMLLFKLEILILIMKLNIAKNIIKHIINIFNFYLNEIIKKFLS